MFVSMRKAKKVFVFKSNERGVSMAFKERLREARLQANMTQVDLAKAVGMTSRTIQNYELGTRKPRGYETVEKIATALSTTADALLSPADVCIMQANEKGGAKAARDIDALVSEVTGLFAGGELSEDALEGAMMALNEAYWIAKKKNQKFTPKKFRSSDNKQSND